MVPYSKVVPTRFYYSKRWLSNNFRYYFLSLLLPLCQFLSKITLLILQSLDVTPSVGHSECKNVSFTPSREIQDISIAHK